MEAQKELKNLKMNLERKKHNFKIGYRNAAKAGSDLPMKFPE